ncbi:hypothetical protein PVAG01_08246 [Phlyctema vagabunda]|uniref:Uncharacterized protein n=1 Tax=Phlyctema vagabunda TaxID=108571 RepID=A0ABR4P8V4_9HELO
MRLSRGVVSWMVVFLICCTRVSAGFRTDTNKRGSEKTTMRGGTEVSWYEQAVSVGLHVFESLEKFERETLRPAAAEAGDAINTFGREQLGPALATAAGISIALDDDDDDDDQTESETQPVDVLSTITELSSQTRASLPRRIQAELERVRALVFQIDLSALPREVQRWIEAHPLQAGLFVVGLVLVIVPELLTGPALAMLGWTSTGPRAASIASALQALIGSVPAAGLRAHLQSAAMEGYGLQTVYTAVRVAGTVVGGIGIVSELDRFIKAHVMPTMSTAHIKGVKDGDGDGDGDGDDAGAGNEDEL